MRWLLGALLALVLAVGLHFAGSDSSSIFNPIEFVLEELSIELVTEDI